MAGPFFMPGHSLARCAMVDVPLGIHGMLRIKAVELSC